jgi:hypothetical protein
LKPFERLAVAARALLLACLLAPAPLLAQAVSDADLQKRANAILTLMGFSLTPDVTTGALSISDQSTGDPYFRQTSVSGGGRVGKTLPLYLEGTLAYSRYDPDFASAGQAQFSVEWDSVMATGGVGWDFPVAKELMLRPIFNLSLGRVESEGTVTPARRRAAATRSTSWAMAGSMRTGWAAP